MPLQRTNKSSPSLATSISASFTTHSHDEIDEFQSSSLRVFQSKKLWGEFQSLLNEENVTNSAAVRARLKEFIKEREDELNDHGAAGGNDGGDYGGTLSRGSGFDLFKLWNNGTPKKNTNPSYNRKSSLDNSSRRNSSFVNRRSSEYDRSDQRGLLGRILNPLDSSKRSSDGMMDDSDRETWVFTDTKHTDEPNKGLFKWRRETGSTSDLTGMTSLRRGSNWSNSSLNSLDSLASEIEETKRYEATLEANKRRGSYHDDLFENFYCSQLDLHGLNVNSDDDSLDESSEGKQERRMSHLSIDLDEEPVLYTSRPMVLDFDPVVNDGEVKDTQRDDFDSGDQEKEEDEENNKDQDEVVKDGEVKPFNLGGGEVKEPTNQELEDEEKEEDEENGGEFEFPEVSRRIYQAKYLSDASIDSFDDVNDALSAEMSERTCKTLNDVAKIYRPRLNSRRNGRGQINSNVSRLNELEQEMIKALEESPSVYNASELHGLGVDGLEQEMIKALDESPGANNASEQGPSNTCRPNNWRRNFSWSLTSSSKPGIDHSERSLASLNDTKLPSNRRNSVSLANPNRNFATWNEGKAKSNRRNSTMTAENNYVIARFVNDQTKEQEVTTNSSTEQVSQTDTETKNRSRRFSWNLFTPKPTGIDESERTLATLNEDNLPSYRRSLGDFSLSEEIPEEASVTENDDCKPKGGPFKSFSWNLNFNPKPSGIDESERTSATLNEDKLPSYRSSNLRDLLSSEDELDEAPEDAVTENDTKPKGPFKSFSWNLRVAPKSNIDESERTLNEAKLPSYKNSNLRAALPSNEEKSEEASPDVNDTPETKGRFKGFRWSLRSSRTSIDESERTSATLNKEKLPSHGASSLNNVFIDPSLFEEIRARGPKKEVISDQIDFGVEESSTLDQELNSTHDELVAHQKVRNTIRQSSHNNGDKNQYLTLRPIQTRPQDKHSIEIPPYSVSTFHCKMGEKTSASASTLDDGSCCTNESDKAVIWKYKDCTD